MTGYPCGARIVNWGVHHEAREAAECQLGSSTGKGAHNVNWRLDSPSLPHPPRAGMCTLSSRSPSPRARVRWEPQEILARQARSAFGCHGPSAECRRSPWCPWPCAKLGPPLLRSDCIAARPVALYLHHLGALRQPGPLRLGRCSGSLPISSRCPNLTEVNRT